jgi:hypothetical protein
MQSGKMYKCGNCNTIVKEKFFSLDFTDIRNTCSICGPLCNNCIVGGGLFSDKKCKGCGTKKLKTENFRGGKWQ